MKIDSRRLARWRATQPKRRLQQVPLAIEARGLVKRFEGFTAVDGVDLSVPEGAIYGVSRP